MGLSNFPSSAEGVLPVLVMNTVMSVAILKNLLRSVMQLMGICSGFEDGTTASSSSSSSSSSGLEIEFCRKMRGIRITQFKYLCVRDRKSKSTEFALGGGESGGKTTVECCVCLCKFGEEEEVSELSCKHFFHKNCLDKWFDNHHTTCPLCRSIH